MIPKDTQVESSEPPNINSLRLWPGVVIVILQWLIRFGIPYFFPDTTTFGVLAGLFGGLGIVVWWVFFSRAVRFERWSGVVLMIAGLTATPVILHESIATAGMGMLFYVYAIPFLSLCFVVWAVASRTLSAGVRRVSMAAVILLSCGVWALVRTGGLTNDLDSDFMWRWSKTPEEQLLSLSGDEPIVPPSAVVLPETEPEWPGFRGAGRDGIIHDVQIETDWSLSPPVELWRRPIGPGWSSFSVHGDLIFTQEQRGEDEAVSCYNLSNGKLVWKHTDKARFWESNGGAGPRGTPTLSGGRVYSFGGTGVLNVLDARDGTVVWSRNAASDTDKNIPVWGFSSSPLVINDIVIVAAGGALLAYDIASGEPRWFGPDGDAENYSSAHHFMINGVTQILLLKGKSLISVNPDNGKLLWEHPLSPGISIVQPALTADGDLLVSFGEISGLLSLTVTHKAEKWTVEEQWSTSQIKPYFNDSVIHEGHIFGFYGPNIVCVDVKSGERKWKSRRYGGQIVLLADQDLLLVLSEKGEIALVEATPEKFTELTRIPAIKGKTWNHPVVVGDILLVRNSQEMAAFRLKVKE